MRALGGSARSLTHLEVRSLACSPAAFASTAQGADSRFDDAERRFGATSAMLGAA